MPLFFVFFGARVWSVSFVLRRTRRGGESPFSFVVGVFLIFLVSVVRMHCVYFPPLLFRCMGRGGTTATRRPLLARRRFRRFRVGFSPNASRRRSGGGRCSENARGGTRSERPPPREREQRRPRRRELRWDGTAATQEGASRRSECRELAVRGGGRRDCPRRRRSTIRVEAG